MGVQHQSMVREAMLYEKMDRQKVHCVLCAHECIIAEGRFGFCGVRRNRGGILYTLVYGEIIASHVDPIEKKPLFHFLPGTRSYSIATIGCNFRCRFCQNWQISQNSKKDGAMFPQRTLLPEEVVEEARQHRCKSISYTYTEPTIFFEFAYDTSMAARIAGLSNVFVTNGYMTDQALNTIQPYLDAANIARFIAGLGEDVPWHISSFHPKYEFTDHQHTPLQTLERAHAIGKRYSLLHIHLGNV